LAVPQVCNPEVDMFWVNESDKCCCTIHTQPCFSPVGASKVLIVDYFLDLSVRVMFQLFYAPTEKIEYVVRNCVIKGEYRL
jgi:hypothetical protein